MNAKLSSNTKAILLLTAPLLASTAVRGKSAGTFKPLSALEYDRLARRLHECDRTPADLLGQESHVILHQCWPESDEVRISRLLERGLLLSQVVEGWHTRSIWVISRADPDYPPGYRRLPGQHRPPVLYGCGDRSLLQDGGLAVVGSRRVSEELIEYTENIGRLAAEAQCIVISGGAKGVDQASVRGALAAGGSAVIVLPGQMENAVGSRDNRDALMNGCLVLISPCDPGMRWSAKWAMGRNKLIYGLSNAALVIESSYNRGGTWSGAVEQLDKLHLVPVYTRTVRPWSVGLTELRAKGALEWPEPETDDDLRAVLAGQNIAPTTDPAEQTALQLAVNEVVEPSDHAVERCVPSVCVGEPRTSAVTPSDELLTVVDRLLAVIDKPITASDVAEHLDVTKMQASAWLKRLEQAGKYQHRYRPARYERVSQSVGEYPRTPAVTPSDEVLTAIDRLLAVIDKPITASDVAEHLDVTKMQASAWLKRLEQAGKYQHRYRPARYERVSQSVGEHPRASAVTSSDKLLTAIDRLLAVIDKPITASDVAEHLDVTKTQANAWLKRLEQAGKYQHRYRPARYERVSQSVGEHPGASTVTPSDELLTVADRLLAVIDKPITASDAAEHLNVTKGQASVWLKRLEQAGKYQHRNNPSRYERISRIAMPMF